MIYPANGTFTIERSPRSEPAHRAPGRPVWTPRRARVARSVAEWLAVPVVPTVPAPVWFRVVWSVGMVGVGVLAVVGAGTVLP